MMFSLKFEMQAGIPPLAWCARLSKTGNVLVWHGSQVEVTSSGFFEGAWNGDFATFDFLNSTTCAGSGGILTENGFNFVCPTHTLERIQSTQTKETLFVSNSMSFLLEVSGKCIDETYLFYQYDFMTVIEGLHRYRRKVPISANDAIEIYYHANFTVGPDLGVSRFPKMMPPSFASYAEYVAFLDDAVSGTLRNSMDPTRSARYMPLATVSSGYDSSAAAVLASRAGCTEAITFVDARGEFDQAQSDTTSNSDSGTRIAQRLGMQTFEYERNEFRGLSGCPEAEFAATGLGGEDAIMAAWGDRLSGRVLLTGFHGDKVWSKENHEVTRDIVRGDASGGSIGEFRLRVGFIHLPVPFIGCSRHPEISQISNSSEMSHWSIVQSGPFRQGYDRPIPRRLLEESGVPRLWFGQSKKAVTQPFALQPGESRNSNLPLSQTLSQQSLSDFSRYVESRTPRLSGWFGIKFNVLRMLYSINAAISWRIAKTDYARVIGALLPRLNWRYQEPLSSHMFFTQWGLSKTRDRYLVAHCSDHVFGCDGNTSLNDETTNV